MPHKYKPYSEYKDIGVLGLEKLPQSWSIKHIKYLFELGRGRVISQEELEDEGTYPVYSSQTKNNGCLGFINTYDFDCKQITWTTDGANAGTVFLREGKHNCTNVCGTLQPKTMSMSIEFILYCLQYVNQFHKRPDTNGAKIMNNEMAEISVPLPSGLEQTQISNFLDHETGKIDKLIEKQQKLIALLEEKRQAVISHAVTKGLNPNVPMKDSGIEWLGDIPEHWNINRLRHLGFLQNGLSKSGDCFGYGFPFVAYKDVYNNKVLPEKVAGLVQSSLSDKAACSVKEGDIFFTRTSETVEEIGLTSVCFKDIDNATFAGFLIRFRPSGMKLTKSFSRFYFQSALHRAYFVKEMNLITRASLSQDLLKKFTVLLPPEDEQEEIGAYLNHKSKIFASLTNKAKSAIELMGERRTALISAAVTGKIDVRETKISTEQKTFKANIHFKRSVLAAEIAERMHHQSKFGRVKFQKTLVLCDLHLGMDIGGNYQRDAAGPFDNRMMRSITSQLKKQKWFQSVKREDGYGTKYEPMEKAGGHQEYFYKYWGDKLSEFNQLLALLEPMKTEQAEIVATLYSAWHDFLKQGKQPTDEELVIEVRTNWHESKKRIEPSRWHKAIDWMRKKSLFPKQRGA